MEAPHAGSCRSCQIGMPVDTGFALGYTLMHILEQQHKDQE